MLGGVRPPIYLRLMQEATLRASTPTGDLAASEDLEVELQLQRGDLRFAGQQLQRSVPSWEVLVRRRENAAALEATDLALAVLREGSSQILGQARSKGATDAGIRRLARTAKREPEAAAAAVYKLFLSSCDKCSDTGWLPTSRRCRCIRGQGWPEYRCPVCEDHGLLDSGELCECRKRRQVAAVSTLINESLLDELPPDSREQAQNFLRAPAEALRNGCGAWITGGQEQPAAARSRARYCGLGSARYLASLAERLGIRVSELTALDLLETSDDENLVQQGTLVVLRSIEQALPTRRLRQRIEILLDDAWQHEGAVFISTSLAGPRSEGTLSRSSIPRATTTRPAWRSLLDRIDESGSSLDFSDLREALWSDRGAPFLGDLHGLMVRPLQADDYLTARAHSLLDRLAPPSRQRSTALAA